MVESFLNEIYRRLRSNQVGIILDGEDLSSEMLEYLPELRKKLKEVGNIRFAQVMYENNIPQKDFDYLRQSGFTDVVVPSNIELSLLLDIYDIVLDKKVDFIVVGTTRESLIPLFVELRKTVTVFAFVDDINRVSKAFIESLDGIIQMDKVDEFTFTSKNFSEIDEIIQNGDDISSKYPDYSEDIISDSDEANIGTFSEDHIEDDQLLDEMKKEKKKN